MRCSPVLLSLALLCLASSGSAQLSGGRFGGSRGFSGSRSSSSRSSSYSGSRSSSRSWSRSSSRSSSSSSSYAERRARREAEARAREERRRRAEESRRQAEERRRRAEELARRRAEESRRRAEELARRRAEESRRRAEELARRRALPEADRAQLPDFVPAPPPEAATLPSPLGTRERPASNAGLLPNEADLAARSNRPEVPSGGVGAGSALLRRPPRIQRVALVFAVVALSGFLILAFFRSARKMGTPLAPEAERQRRDGAPHDASRGSAIGRCTLRRLSLAIDWRRRAEVQETLEALAGRYDLGEVSGLASAARATRELLLDTLAEARYATWQSFRETERGAESRLVSLTNDVRARYQTDIVDNATRRDAPEVEARPEEGEGLVVVTMIVGTTVLLPPLPSVLDRFAFSTALKELLPWRDEDLVALEVVWSPAAEQDRLSSLELEARYPELLRLDGDPALGRVGCSFCSAVYPGELESCPNCGAPRSA